MTGKFKTGDVVRYTAGSSDHKGKIYVVHESTHTCESSGCVHLFLKGSGGKVIDYADDRFLEKVSTTPLQFF